MKLKNLAGIGLLSATLLITSAAQAEGTLRLAQQFDFDVQLRLWHQVAVLPPANPPFEYLNCHPRTGLLPYFG